MEDFEDESSIIVPMRVVMTGNRRSKRWKHHGEAMTIAKQYRVTNRDWDVHPITIWAVTTSSHFASNS